MLLRYRVALSALIAATFIESLALAQPAPPDPPPADPPARPAAPPPDAPLVPPETSPPAVSSVSAADPKIEALERRVAESEARLKTIEEKNAIAKRFRFESFIQPQLLVQSFDEAASPNRVNGVLPPGVEANDITARADGTTTNGTFFRVRRARARIFHETDVTRLFLQIDAFPAGGIGPGIGTILRQAEATGIARWTPWIRTEFTAGLFFTPFRRELIEPSVIRPFIERTWFVQNCFPTERDYGVHAKTIAFKDGLVLDLAVVNGQRLGERTFTALPDLSRSKDFIAYATYKIGFVTVGASAYVGRGQIVDTQLLRFKHYDRWAVNGQVSAEKKLLPDLGETRLYSELTFGQNMDSGVNYAFALPKIRPDFAADVENVSERGFYVRLEQEIGKYLLAGYRYDMYTPDASIKNNARDTHGFLAGIRFSPHLRWMNEVMLITDNVHAVNTPAPSRSITQFSSVLQAMF